jgi:hypothetical protein
VGAVVLHHAGSNFGKHLVANELAEVVLDAVLVALDEDGAPLALGDDVEFVSFGGTRWCAIPGPVVAGHLFSRLTLKPKWLHCDPEGTTGGTRGEPFPASGKMAGKYQKIVPKPCLVC